MNRRIVAVAQHLMLLYRFEIGAYIERVVRGYRTPQLWSIGWNCRSAKICNISGSTARWSVVWWDC